MQLLLMAVDHRHYKAGDVISMIDDGAPWGKDEDPATATNGLFAVVRAPGGSRGRLRYLLQYEIDELVPWIDVPRPGHPDGPTRRPNHIGSRRYRLDPQLLPPGQRGQFRAGRFVDLPNEAGFEAAVRDRGRGNQPVDRGNLPRD